LKGFNYHPFGMVQPGRKFSLSTLYRFGFNGKENDNDVKGEGNQQDYGMRIYDPRVSRFLSVDPLMGKYPMLTPYQFTSNSPIAGVDLDGLEFYFAADGTYLGQSKNGGTQIRVATEFHTNPNDKSQFVLTKYQEIEKVDEAVASKVYATIYKREVRNPHSPNVSASAETSGNAFAGTDPATKNITVYFKQSMSSDDGTRQKLMTDYYNAASTLNHEDDHASGLTSNGFDHFKIGVRESSNRFQTRVSKYYKENLISNMRSYLMDQVNSVLYFRDRGDNVSEAYYRKEYEKNLKTFNRLFGKNDQSFFKIIEEKSKEKKPQSNP
jgi:RHS repeat-associated protein